MANCNTRYIVVPESQIPQDTLNNILEEFITREGTDYGDYELSLQQKVDRLKIQVLEGHVVVVYDSVMESVNVINKKDYESIVDKKI